VWASVIAVVALVAAVIREWNTEDPVVDLRLLRDRNFVISTFLMYILGIVIYGAQVLVPILLQTLMGYTAMKSGLAVLPGGLVLIVMLPFVGRLLDRMEPRRIVVTGLCIAALAAFRLSHFNLEAGMGTMVWDWVVSRMGTACLFVPINVMAFYFVPREKTSAATGLINLARNVGGSTGISFMATLLTRRAQFHQGTLVSHLQNANHDYRAALEHLTHVLMTRGADAARAVMEAQGLIYRELQHQAMMLAFADCFWFLGILCLVVLPLIFLMRMPKGREGRVPAH
jgi:DHA2 family multidrug resistance protein